MKTHIQGKDLYTKIVLTIIALALCLIGLNPWIAPTTAFGKAPVPVRIAEIDNTALMFLTSIPVEIKNPSGIRVNNVLPVPVNIMNAPIKVQADIEVPLPVKIKNTPIGVEIENTPISVEVDNWP